MRRIILIAIVICFVAGDKVAAQSSGMTFTGADLLKACTITDYEWIGFCNGYLQAAFDAAGGGICAPKGITRNQVFDIVLPKLMSSNLLKLNASVVMAAILHKAFPCG